MIIHNAIDQFAYDMVNGLEFPQFIVGKGAPNGAVTPYSKLPVGSRYMYAIDKNIRRWYTKRKNDGRTDDWALGPFEIVKRVLFSDFTDGGAAIGTLTLTETIPVGAFVQQALLTDVTGFTGDTSATIQIGDGTDADRYSTGTPSIFTTAAAIDPGVPSGVKIHIAAKAPVITVTSAAVFTAVEAGAFTLRIHCLG